METETETLIDNQEKINYTAEAKQFAKEVFTRRLCVDIAQACSIVGAVGLTCAIVARLIR